MATSSGSGEVESDEDGLAALAAGQDVTDLKIKVVICFNANLNESYEVIISLKDTIRDVKEKLSLCSNTPANSINLALAGQLMGNHRRVEEFGLGSYTTLQAFCWIDKIPVNDKQHLASLNPGEPSALDEGDRPKVYKTPTCATDESFQKSEIPIWNTLFGRILFGSVPACAPTWVVALLGRKRFFVFCKICASVRPGKLRVQCRKCDSLTFLVDRGPSSWTDISPHTEIRGECRSCHCNIPLFNMQCSVSHSDELAAGTTVVLRHVQANRRKVECIICTNVMSLILIFPCFDGHVMCLDCFRQYGACSLSETRFVEHPKHGYTLPCPAMCEDSHIKESHHFLLMGKEMYERYKNLAAEEYVLQNGGIMCPSPGCGMGLVPDKGEREVHCPECKTTCCKKCLREFHSGECEKYQSSNTLNVNGLIVSGERAQMASWEKQLQNVKEETTKACPGCKCKTEKSGGCMHVICSHCQQDWCWICCKTWDRDCQIDHWFA